jgi:long-chain acyl-CoA synthetase
MITTLCELLLNSVEAYPKPEFLLVKKNDRFTPISMEDFGARVRHLSLGLQDLGLAPGDKLIILSENRPEWTMTDFACLAAGGVTVPIYTTLVPEQVKYIINDSDAKIVVFSNEFQGGKIAAVKADLLNVKHYITFADTAPEGCLAWSNVIARGTEIDKAQPRRFEDMARAIRPDDEASIIYTSGTTGVPKGVILTHGNLVFNVKAAAAALDFNVTDTVLSFLPLSHILERMVTYAYVYKGCTIAYAESVEAVAQNLVEIRPHIMVSVPRIFEKIYAKVMDNVLSGSGLKRKIFFWGIKVGKDYGRRKLERRKIGRGLSVRRNLAHKLVFIKIIEKMGGRIRFFVSGGAPLSKDIAEFFYALGIFIMEGYGLTETSPIISVNTFKNLRFGTVGKPIPGIEVKIAPDGEILTRGPHVMKGYHKKPEENREIFEGGWLKTGDIGTFDADGFLTITDRKKDLIVTAGGKNIAPQPIENILKTNPYILNAVVIGDRMHFIAALIVPNFEKLEDYATCSRIPFSSRADLVKNEQIMNFLKAEIERATPNLASYERIKRIALLDRDFEIEQGEITPSLKVRRAVIEKKYKGVIEALYKEETG